MINILGRLESLRHAIAFGALRSSSQIHSHTIDNLHSRVCLILHSENYRSNAFSLSKIEIRIPSHNPYSAIAPFCSPEKPIPKSVLRRVVYPFRFPCYLCFENPPKWNDQIKTPSECIAATIFCNIRTVDDRYASSGNMRTKQIRFVVMQVVNDVR